MRYFMIQHLFRHSRKRRALRCGIAVMVAAALAVNTPTASTAATTEPSVLEIQLLVDSLLPGAVEAPTRHGSHVTADILRLQRALAGANVPDEPEAGSASPFLLAIVPCLTRTPVDHAKLSTACAPVTAAGIPMPARPMWFRDPPGRLPGWDRYLFNLMPNAPPVTLNGPMLCTT